MWNEWQYRKNRTNLIQSIETETKKITFTRNKKKREKENTNWKAKHEKYPKNGEKWTANEKFIEWKFYK